jgi:hypothetical protein
MLSNSLQRKQKEEMELGQAVAARCHFDLPLEHWARGFLNGRQTGPKNSVSGFFFSWRDTPPGGLGILLIHEDFCSF